MPERTPQSAIEQVAALLGEWEVRSPQHPDLRGRVVFEWLEGRANLLQRSSLPAPFPSNTWLIGGDDADEDLIALYADARGVSREYRMRFDAGTWLIWRDAPGFWQRFTAALSADGMRITGVWEKSFDGTTWQHDFDLIYTKVA